VCSNEHSGWQFSATERPRRSLNVESRILTRTSDLSTGSLEFSRHLRKSCEGQDSVAATTCRKSGSFAGDSCKYTEFQVSGKVRHSASQDFRLPCIVPLAGHSCGRLPAATEKRAGENGANALAMAIQAEKTRAAPASTGAFSCAAIAAVSPCSVVVSVVDLESLTSP